MLNYYQKYKSCDLCARACGVDRTNEERGFCRMLDIPVIARAALHHWEEPIISGTNGSGTVFFVGCSLGCVYCQNKLISRGNGGRAVSADDLAREYLRLESLGAHNINLVTPTHYVPSIIDSVALARKLGLAIPIVYNTGSYDTVETIRALSGTVDIFLPDFKYYRADKAKEYSRAENYREVAMAAIDEMVNIVGDPVVEDGIMKSGVIVRLLLLPGMVADAKLNLKYLYNKYGDRIYISLMSQYTPSDDLIRPLDRRVTQSEYNELVDYATRLGVTNAFIQDRNSAEDAYIPDFDV